VLHAQKPDIVFFGENCPASVYRKIEGDCKSSDLIIVIGTSLKVRGPVTRLLDLAPEGVPVLLINNEVVTYHTVTVPEDSQDSQKKKKQKIESPDENNCPSPFCAALLGPCDDVIEYVCDVNGWSDALRSAKAGRPPPPAPAGEDAAADEKGVTKAKSIKREPPAAAPAVRHSGRRTCATRLPDMVYGEEESCAVKGAGAGEEGEEGEGASPLSAGGAPPREEEVKGPIYFETDAVLSRVYRLCREEVLPEPKSKKCSASTKKNVNAGRKEKNLYS
jgi:hypothetical protein